MQRQNPKMTAKWSQPPRPPAPQARGPRKNKRQLLTRIYVDIVLYTKRQKLLQKYRQVVDQNWPKLGQGELLSVSR